MSGRLGDSGRRELLETIAERLVVIEKRSGLARENFAQAIGLSKTGYYRIHRGDRASP